MLVGELRINAYLALVHYPVYDKNHKVVATSVTNLDIHDIARACRTYGIAAYHLVHPVSAQRDLIRRIAGHWQTADGMAQNECRSEALSLVQVSASIEEVIREIQNRHQAPPFVVATSARARSCVVSPKQLLSRPELASRPLLLLFGTGWGLQDEWLDRADGILEPIMSGATYNHLAVRTAVGIILDRLFNGAQA